MKEDPTLELAIRLIHFANSASSFDYDFEATEIGCQEPYKCEPEIVELGDDYYYLNENLDASEYGLETDWTTDKPMVIGPSGGDPERTIIYIHENTLSELKAFEKEELKQKCECGAVIAGYSKHVRCHNCGEMI